MNSKVTGLDGQHRGGNQQKNGGKNVAQNTVKQRNLRGKHRKLRVKQTKVILFRGKMYGKFEGFPSTNVHEVWVGVT